VVHVHVVGCDAGLARVGELGPHDVSGGQAQVGAGINDGGAFAPQLQCDAGQMVGCCSHDLFANGRAAGEEHMVERQLLQLDGQLCVALQHGHFVFGKDFAHDFGNQCRQVRRELGRFDDGGVARRHGRHQWPQCQVHRVVERPDDQAASLGLVLHMAARAQRQQGWAHTPWLHPLFEVADGVVGLQADGQDFGQIDLAGRFAKVRMRRAVPGFGACNDGVAQLADLDHAFLPGGLAQAQCGGGLKGKDFFQSGGIGHSWLRRGIQLAFSSV